MISKSPRGEPGDRYYLVVAGTVERHDQGPRCTHHDGRRLVRRDRAVAECASSGDGDVRHTAMSLLAAITTGDDFLETVTGHPRSLATATQIADGLAPL